MKVELVLDIRNEVDGTYPCRIHDVEESKLLEFLYETESHGPILEIYIDDVKIDDTEHGDKLEAYAEARASVEQKYMDEHPELYDADGTYIGPT